MASSYSSEGKKFSHYHLFPCSQKEVMLFLATKSRERLFSTSVGVDSTKDEILFFFFFYIYLFSNKKKEIYMHICTRRGSFSLSVSQSGSIYRTNHGTQILMIKQFECIAASYVRVSLLFNSVTHSSECGQRNPAVREMINIITRSQV